MLYEWWFVRSHVWSVLEIAAELTVSPRTVESHRASIQRKLMVRTRAELARLARDAGLLD